MFIGMCPPASHLLYIAANFVPVLSYLVRWVLRIPSCPGLVPTFIFFRAFTTSLPVIGIKRPVLSAGGRRPPCPRVRNSPWAPHRSVYALVTSSTGTLHLGGSPSSILVAALDLSFLHKVCHAAYQDLFVGSLGVSLDTFSAPFRCLIPNVFFISLTNLIASLSIWVLVGVCGISPSKIEPSWLGPEARRLGLRAVCS